MSDKLTTEKEKMQSLDTIGLRLVAERALEAQCFNLALLPIRTTNYECSTSALFATNRCYVLGGLSALNLN